MNISNKKIVNYCTEDFLKDESFIDWVRSGELEEATWSHTLKKHPTLVNYANDAAQIINDISFREDAPTRYRIARIKTVLDTNIKKKPSLGVGEVYSMNTSSSHAQPEKKSLFRMLLSVAAVVALVIASIWVFKSEEKSELNNNLVTINKVTGKGQKLTVHLKDGSKVKMNSGTTIKYNESFTNSSRVVYLSGEAFFEVAKDTQRPFKVITKNTTTTALGTSFNVNSGQTDNPTITSLQSGKVSVERGIDSSYEKVILEPGQQAISLEGQPITVQQFNTDLFAWKEGVLIFNKDSHLEVFEKLENWYGVEFEISQANQKKVNWDYTGKFENENLKNVLGSIGYVKKFTFDINKEAVIINLN